MSFALNQNNNDPDAWRKLLSFAADAAAEGAAITPQVHGRTVSLLLGLQTFHPFNFCPTWSTIPVIVASTRDDAETRLRVRELGAQALLSKPVDPLELAHELAHLLRDLRADWVCRRGQGEGDVGLLTLDLDVVDEAEGDEVEAELGVDHFLECL